MTPKEDYIAGEVSTRWKGDSIEGTLDETPNKRSKIIPL